jgi:hypothetical protein
MLPNVNLKKNKRNKRLESPVKEGNHFFFIMEHVSYVHMPILK